jgi:hypothetical protein
MTIDERLEALAQSLELLSHMHGATEKRLEELVQSQAKTDETLRGFIQTMEEVNAVNTDILNRLERNTADHREWLGAHALALAKQQKALESQQKTLAARDRDMAELRKMFKQFLRGKRSNGRS